MTPAQREALTWAIEQAQMKQDVARRAANQSSTAFGERMHRADTEKFCGITEALQSLLKGDSNA
jgi:hypothetical protein